MLAPLGDVEDLTGRKFGQYELGAPIGAGGMAAVYEAYQPAVDRFVAVKILSRHLTADPQFAERFRHEARTVAQFQHPHVVPVFDFGETEGYSFLVMPLIRGGTLADLMSGLPVSLALAVRVVREVAEALDYAHSKGVIHRDIKPSNILMDEGGNCLVADFGVARIAGGAANLTMQGTVVGTPAYMSPEQVAGESVVPQSDLYSLGVVLYEMLTGRVPFNAETPIGTALKHLTARVPKPRSVNPALEPRLEAVVLKALARAPKDRFRSGDELATALSACVGPIGRAPRPGRRKPATPPGPPDVAATKILPNITRVRRTRWVAVAAILAASTLATLPSRLGSTAFGLAEQSSAVSSDRESSAGAASATGPTVFPSALPTAKTPGGGSMARIPTITAFDPAPAATRPLTEVADAAALSDSITTPAAYPWEWQAVLEAAKRSDYPALESALQRLPAVPRSRIVDAPEARRANSRALELVSNGQYVEALPLLQRARVLDGTDAEIAGNLADVLMHLGRFDEALATGLASVRLNPKRSISWGLLGFLYAKTDQPDAAVACLTTGYHYSQNQAKTLQIYRAMGNNDYDPKVRAVMQRAVTHTTRSQTSN